MSAVPKVSVVLPVHAPSQELNRSIASVLKQGLSELELIVVDGPDSGFGVEATVARFAESDSRLRYLRSESAGRTAVVAAGLQATQAPWIAFQKDGDEWLLDRLAQQLAYAARQGEDCYLIAGRLLQYMPVARTRMRYWPTSADSGRLALNEDINDFAAFMQTALIRREAIQAVSDFDPQGSGPEGFDWCRRLLEQGRVAAAPTCVAVTYLSSGIEKPHPAIEWLRQALKR